MDEEDKERKCLHATGCKVKTIGTDTAIFCNDCGKCMWASNKTIIDKFLEEDSNGKVSNM
jgi:hypothetical protein